VSVEVQPPELAELVDYAERPRVGDWSLRAALTRYAQPQPQRVGDVLDLVRRIDAALGAQRRALESEGPELWVAVQATDGGGQSSDRLVGLLRAARELDQLGDVLAAWADDPTTDRPDPAVDAAVSDVTRQLDELGIPREERTRPSRRDARQP
jgi:hypothetical protein